MPNIPTIAVKESLDDLKEIGPSTGLSGFKLVTVIGKGTYQWVSGDQSANVGTDTWVAPAEDTSGKSGAWNRIGRTGLDENVVSGTAGGSWELGIWNTDGDLVGGIPALPGFIDGLELSNGTDADHDIDIATGVCSMRDGSGNRKLLSLTSGLTKQIDANWAEGTDAGGFPSGLTSGTPQADTWYHVFAIGKDDGSVDGGFDTSTSAANLLSDASAYSWFRRLGSILTDGSSNIIGFNQDHDHFYWNDPPLDVNVQNPGTSANLRTMTVPTDFSFTWIGNAIIGMGGTTQTAWYISDPSVNDEAPANNAAPLATVFNGDGAAGSYGGLRFVRTNTSSQIRSRFSVSDGNVNERLVTLGWIDPRGRDQ